MLTWLDLTAFQSNNCCRLELVTVLCFKLVVGQLHAGCAHQRIDPGAGNKHRPTNNELQKLLIDVELFMHLHGHRLELTSCNTDVITQQLVASCTTGACWQPDSLMRKAEQGLTPWQHPPSELWLERQGLASSVCNILSWLHSCDEHAHLDATLTSKLCWLVASQVAGTCCKMLGTC